jgi:hypothetical protein
VLGAVVGRLGAGDGLAPGDPPLGPADVETALLGAGNPLGAVAPLGAGAAVRMGVRKPPTPPIRP